MTAPLARPFDGSKVIGTPYSQTRGVSLPFVLVHPAVVDLHVILVGEPLPAYSAMLNQFFAQVITRRQKKDLRKSDLLVDNPCQDRGLNIIIIHTRGGLASAEFHVSLELLPHPEPVTAIHTLRHTLLAMQKSIEPFADRLVLPTSMDLGTMLSQGC